MENFEKTHFLSRKFLLSMKEGETRMVGVSKCSYSSLKSTCSQLKSMGVGEWKVTKKFGAGGDFTRVTRTRIN